MTNFRRICFVFSLAIASCQAIDKNGFNQSSVDSETIKVNTYFQKYFDEKIKRHPQMQTRFGIKTDQDKWDQIDEEYRKRELQIANQALRWMIDSVKFEMLDNATKISYELFVGKLKEEIEDFEFRYYSYPINQMFGLHSQCPDILINQHKVENKDDAEDYVARIRATLLLMEDAIVNMKRAEGMGIVPPRFVHARVIDDCTNLVAGISQSGCESNELMQDFLKKLGKITHVEPERSTLKNAAQQALNNQFKPAYELLITFFKNQQTRATDDAGVWKFPNGDIYYKNRLKRITTTDLSAEDIHTIGLSEVERIHGEILEIMKAVSFVGELKDFFIHLKTDDKFYFSNTDEGKQQCLDSAIVLIDNMKNRLDEVFITKPKAEMIVKRLEKFREKSAGQAFYNRP